MEAGRSRRVWTALPFDPVDGRSCRGAVRDVLGRSLSMPPVTDLMHGNARLMHRAGNLRMSCLAAAALSMAVMVCSFLPCPSGG